ncbi:cytochrome P450 [Antricoccus suffuscus]|uniref:Cytochrome P450 n=1 Tax=Antricoccus suffuscus TaxID=1629062 RepID=A0A2T1A1C8_9ACTN|nr:cytochrome P450 [Antricoccus suffuscus]PRZ42411.1 cytochrome P450 [Antricoccus suffuscus]
MSEVPFVMPLLRDGVNPVEELGALRSEQPIVQLEIPGIGVKVWLVTRYDDVKAFLGDHARFSNDFSKVTEAGELQMLLQQDPGGLGMIDPPDHSRLRKILTPEFTMRRLRRLVPKIDAIVAAQLDEVEKAGQGADLVEHYAMPIPALVICDLLGVPYEERDEFQKHSQDRFNFTGDFSDSLGEIGESLKYMGGVVAKIRQNPNDGLIGQIIAEHGDAITDVELAGLADGILTGGHETTASMISLAAHVLMKNPDHVALMRDGDDKQVSDIVDELLRYLTVVQVPFPRLAKEDLVLGGQQIKAGELVIGSLVAANRDESLGANMDEFVPERGSMSHLAFSYGIHRCIGAELGRMELRQALPALFKRFPTLQHQGPIDETEFRMFSIVFGIESLPVAW